jgi:drug/metabolite transporter (DMT)-like permease
MLKHAGHNNQREMHVYFINYLVAGSLALLLSESELSALFTKETFLLLIFGVMVGVLYISNLIIMGRSMIDNGIGLTVSIMRISLVLPVIFAIVFFDENISILRAIGLLIAFGALGLLFRPDGRDRNKKAILYLVTIFLIAGLGDISLKFFESMQTPAIDEWLFMAIIFGTCGIISLLFILFSSKPMPSSSESISGFLIGVPNLLASVFVLIALDQLPASVVFPSVNLIVIVLGTVWGAIYWKDRLTKRNYIIIGLAVVAIVLLTLDL